MTPPLPPLLLEGLDIRDLVDVDRAMDRLEKDLAEDMDSVRGLLLALVGGRGILFFKVSDDELFVFIRIRPLLLLLLLLLLLVVLLLAVVCGGMSSLSLFWF
jgi:hypothetical protein